MNVTVSRHSDFEREIEYSGASECPVPDGRYSWMRLKNVSELYPETNVSTPTVVSSVLIFMENSGDRFRRKARKNVSYKVPPGEKKKPRLRTNGKLFARNLKSAHRQNDIRHDDLLTIGASLPVVIVLENKEGKKNTRTHI